MLLHNEDYNRDVYITINKKSGLLMFSVWIKECSKLDVTFELRLRGQTYDREEAQSSRKQKYGSL